MQMCRGSDTTTPQYSHTYVGSYFPGLHRCFARVVTLPHVLQSWIFLAGVFFGAGFFACFFVVIGAPPSVMKVLVLLDIACKICFVKTQHFEKIDG